MSSVDQQKIDALADKILTLPTQARIEVLAELEGQDETQIGEIVKEVKKLDSHERDELFEKIEKEQLATPYSSNLLSVSVKRVKPSLQSSEFSARKAKKKVTLETINGQGCICYNGKRNKYCLCTFVRIE
jgi:hypothetical protein